MSRLLFTHLALAVCSVALFANSHQGNQQLQQVGNEPSQGLRPRPTNRESASLVRPGMSVDQVEEILGVALDLFSYGDGSLRAYWDDPDIFVWFDTDWKAVGGAWFLIDGKYVPANRS